ncbi:MAG: SDR family NAD(P)-dependent oxidoreductase, partial [Burkholderiales bacterium]
MAPRIWFITGVSSGLGRCLAQAVATRGDIAVGTLRQDAQFAAYAALVPGRTVPVKLDVNDHARVESVVGAV